MIHHLLEKSGVIFYIHYPGKQKESILILHISDCFRLEHFYRHFVLQLEQLNPLFLSFCKKTTQWSTTFLKSSFVLFQSNSFLVLDSAKAL